MNMRLIFLYLFSLPFMGNPLWSLDAPTETELLAGLSLYNSQPHYAHPRMAFMCRSPVAADWALHKENFGPHDVMIDIYLNEIARVAVNLKQPFPVGSIIVKKQRAPQAPVEKIIGGMKKQADGYDDGQQNWQYFTLTETGVYTVGKMPQCSACHSKTPGYVFKTWIDKK